MNSIIFLSYDEPNAEKNWIQLKSRFPRALRVSGVSGIVTAHKACAELSLTEHFFLVDGDNEILDSFDFSYSAGPSETDSIHVWRCKNPVNQLVYGYGAVKLYSRSLLQNASSGVDLATSVSKKYKIMPELASITHFNTNPYNTWRSAFRECVKLSSQIIHGQNSQETQERLDSWCRIGEDQPNGKWCLAGAKAGREYGSLNRDNKNALSQINDFDWLKKQFEAHGKNGI